jgi:phage-related protein
MEEIRFVLYQGQAFTIEWYYTENYDSPAREFFLGLDEDRQAALLALAKRLGDMGQIRDLRKFRNEGDKIFALKSQPERFLSFFFTGRKVIITNAFVKKSDKLPPGEKDWALRAKRDYETRVNGKKYYEKAKKIQK